MRALAHTPVTRNGSRERVLRFGEAVVLAVVKMIDDEESTVLFGEKCVRSFIKAWVHTMLEGAFLHRPWGMPLKVSWRDVAFL